MRRRSQVHLSSRLLAWGSLKLHTWDIIDRANTLPSLWAPYTRSSQTLKSPFWHSTSIVLSTALNVNLSKMQPHFTLLDGDHVSQTYSFGYLLRLYFLRAKRLRRDLRRPALAASFFAKYFGQTFLESYSVLIIRGYKKRYNVFFFSALAKLGSKYFAHTVLLPQTLSGAFAFRRVKGVKKRIRKRLAQSPK